MRDEHVEGRGQLVGLSSLLVAPGDRTPPASRLWLQSSCA